MSDEPRPTPGFLLWRLTMRWQAAVDKAVAPFGLTHAQYSMLASLRGMSRDGTRPSQRQLADHTGLDPIFVSKLVRTLADNGLVTRTTNPVDSRAVELVLTRKGLATADRAIDAVIKLQDRLTEPLGGLRDKRTAQFINTLQRLLAAPLP